MSLAFAAALDGLADGMTDRRERERAAEEERRAAEVPGIWAEGPPAGADARAPAPGKSYERNAVAANPYTGTISDRVTHAYQRFRGAGLPHHVAAGLTGNLMQESGSKINPAAVGDNGNAFGAPQFNGPRRRAYLKFAASRGVSPDDFDAQIDYLLHEGRTTEKSAFDAILATRTAEEAAAVASKRFWRPGAPHLSNRIGYAQSVAKKFAPAPAEEVGIGLPPGETTWKWFKETS